MGELAWRLLDLRPGMSVLDLACGHGDLANRLAARGCRVTGLDSSAVFLDRARADAAASGVSVEYLAGDMRQIAWTGRFDRVINWSTAFGYFDDPANRAVLDRIVRVLRPGGRLAMDLDNLTSFLPAMERTPGHSPPITGGWSLSRTCHNNWPAWPQAPTGATSPG